MISPASQNQLTNWSMSNDCQVNSDILNCQDNHCKSNIVPSDRTWHKLSEEHQEVGKNDYGEIVVELEFVGEGVIQGLNLTDYN